MLELVEAEKTIRLPGGGELPVIRRASLNVSAGESVGILGRSGSGKSTLLGLLGLIDSLDKGNYLVNGRETVRLSDRQTAQVRMENFGFIYQRFCLLSHLSAYDNVMAPLLHRKVPSRDRRAVVRDALERVELSDRASHRPDRLSGGEQQRVAIARAFACSPKTILADEPTGSLDGRTGQHVLTLLLDMVRDANVALVVVTHDEQIARRLDRSLRMSDGVLMED